jgi:hypothetical protein
MQCKYCDRQVYVSQICLYCQDYYCKEHSEPITHNCPSHKQPHQPTVKPQPTAAELEEPQKHFLSTRNISKSLFTATFLLVIFEEVLRQVSYAQNSPLFEPNAYVTMMSQWITPYIASSIVFLTVCAVLFAVKKLASKPQGDSDNSHVKFLKKAIPFGLYAIIIAVYLPTTIQWLSLLLI